MSIVESRVTSRRLRPLFDASALVAAVRRDGLVLAVILGFSALSLTLDAQRRGVAQSLSEIARSFNGALVDFLPAAAICAVVLWFLRCVFVVKPKHPLLQLAKDAATTIRERRIENWLPLLLGCSAMIVAFTRMKGGIPHLAGGFGWDPVLSEIDRLVHFGRYPFEWLQPLLGHPAILFLLNLNYNIWFVVMWACFFAFAARGGGAPGRTRYLLGFIVTWAVAGALVATLFASAGPCFYGLVVSGPDPYAPLMTHLRAADAVLPIWALDVQPMLWADYASGAGELGISAMPSLHNATAALAVLASRHLGRRARAFLAAHAVLVLLGSILLAWHYAIDAYAGWVLAAAVWYGCGPLARWWDARVAGAAPARA